MESSGITGNSRSPADCATFRQTFDLLANHSQIVDDAELKKYAKQWIRPRIIQQIEEIEAALPAAADPAAPRDRVAQGQAAFIVAPVSPTRPH